MSSHFYLERKKKTNKQKQINNTKRDKENKTKHTLEGAFIWYKDNDDDDDDDYNNDFF